MSSFSFTPQHDAMQCGVACLQMICQHHGQEYTIEELSDLCFATRQGVSLLGLSEAAGQLGLHTVCGNVTIEMLRKAPLPCILHWNQTHFVVLYNVKRNGDFQIADPAKGLISYNEEQLFEHWISTISGGKEKGVAMFLQPTPDFKKNEKKYGKGDKCRSFHFLYNYIKNYRKYFIQILLGLIVGCLLQLILPFLTQTIVDTGIRNKDIGFVWLVLLGQLMLTVSRTALDFVRRLLLLHISMRINLSLVSDFFIKLFRLPMAFFDTKLMGDILQRINDHERVEHFLTSQTLTIAFSIFSMGVFGIVLCCYNSAIFIIFLLGSIIYALWIALFLHKRKQIDYALFECMASNNNKTYEMITSMQEIKLQDCEQRRRWEWEDTQADLFAVQIKSLKLQQAQEAGSIFINELKNIIITVVAATAVIKGELTLGMMLAVQYIIGQLNSPVEQVMNFIYSLQDVKISLERINEIHQKTEEDSNSEQIVDLVKDNGNIKLNNVSFRYDKNSLKKTINNISLNIEEGKVTAIVGASGSGKTTLLKLLLYLQQLEHLLLAVQQYRAMKADSDVAKTLIEKSEYYETCLDDSAIIFGNPNAKILVTILSNPHCNPCARMHKRVEELLGTEDKEICVQYVFSSFNKQLEDSSRYLISCYFNNTGKEALRRFALWYTKEKYDYERIVKQNFESIHTHEIEEEMKKHAAWRKKTSLVATPTVLVNGHILPDEYDLEDLAMITNVYIREKNILQDINGRSTTPLGADQLSAEKAVHSFT